MVVVLVVASAILMNVMDAARIGDTREGWAKVRAKMWAPKAVPGLRPSRLDLKPFRKNARAGHGCVLKASGLDFPIVCKEDNVTTQCVYCSNGGYAVGAGEEVYTVECTVKTKPFTWKGVLTYTWDRIPTQRVPNCVNLLNKVDEGATELPCFEFTKEFTGGGGHGNGLKANVTNCRTPTRDGSYQGKPVPIVNIGIHKLKFKGSDGELFLAQGFNKDKVSQEVLYIG